MNNTSLTALTRTSRWVNSARIAALFPSKAAIWSAESLSWIKINKKNCANYVRNGTLTLSAKLTSTSGWVNSSTMALPSSELVAHMSAVVPCCEIKQGTSVHITNRLPCTFTSRTYLVYSIYVNMRVCQQHFNASSAIPNRSNWKNRVAVLIYKTILK